MQKSRLLTNPLDKQHPCLQLSVLKIKMDSHLYQQLQMSQILTKTYDHLFVKVFCFQVESDTLSILHEPVLKDVDMTQLKKEETPEAEEICKQMHQLKEKAILAMEKEGVEVAPQQIVCSYVINPHYDPSNKQGSKYLIKARLAGYKLANASFAPKSDQTLLQKLEHQIVPLSLPNQKVFSKLISELDQLAEAQQQDSATDIKRLLKIEQTYYGNVFDETDLIVQERQFRGEVKWLNELFVMLNPSLDKMYTCVDCVDHFSTFTAEQVTKIRAQGSSSQRTPFCEVCKAPLINLVNDRVLNFLNRNVYNPKRKQIVYFPRHNRFKMIHKENTITGVQVEGTGKQEQPQQAIFKFSYQNYYHFRDTTKKLSGPCSQRPAITPAQSVESFDIWFRIGDKKAIIRDPCRSRYCRHLSFMDLRELYSTEKHGVYCCTICKQPIKQQDIVYLHEVVILLKLAEQIFRKKEETEGAGPSLGKYANLLNKQSQPLKFGGKYREYRFLHNSQTVGLEITHTGPKNTVKLKYKTHIVESESVSVDRIYKTLLDPMWYFDESQLGVEDQEMESMIYNYQWGQQA